MTTTTPLVTGTDFIAIGTRDIDTAEPFYRDVLGLPVRKRWGQMPGVEFETGNLPIALHVDDFDAAKAELESRGVEFRTDVIDSGVCKQAFFQDPDGNMIG